MNFMNQIPGKINPTLFSAGKRLLFTETACFIESDGLELKLPTSNANNQIVFQFCFSSEADKSKPSIKLDLIDNMTIRITLIHFNNPLGTGTTSPLEFNIDNKKHFLLIYTTGLINTEFPDRNLINMTVSMYREGM